MSHVRPRDRAERDAIRRVLRWMLGAQVALAVLLVLADLAPRVPELLHRTDVPELDRPVAPGDQTRRYRPNRPARPGPGIDPDMPRRLVAETVAHDGAPALRLRGAIAPGDGARLRDLLEADPPGLVLLDSPGGSVSDALEIGRILRGLGARTRLADGAICLSACPYIFAGGTERSLHETARLGVHQHSFEASVILPMVFAIEEIQRGQAEVLAHLDAMGIDLRVMGPALATPAQEIYILSADELRDWTLVTP